MRWEGRQLQMPQGCYRGLPVVKEDETFVPLSLRTFSTIQSGVTIARVQL